MEEYRTSRVVSRTVVRIPAAGVRRRAGTLVLATIAVATACAPGDDAPDAPPPVVPATDRTLPDVAPPAVHEPDPQAPPRAAEIRDTLVIEGMPEVVTFRLFRTPAGATVPFSTYVPEGIDAVFEGDSDTLSVRFPAAFNGMPHPNAYMHVRFYPAGATRREVRATVFAFLRSRAPAGEESQPADAPGWAEEAHAFTYRGDGNVLHVGRAIIASHGGRFFHVLTHYPAEFGDGLGPRFARILAHWRWEDTGEMLFGGVSPG